MTLRQLESCTISDKFFNLKLFQVVPGREFDVLKHLRKLAPKSGFFMGLGRYDLILVDESKDFNIISDLRIDPPPFIIDRNVICGYKWVLNKKAERELDKDSEIMGFCFLRINWDETKQSRIEAEHKIVEAIYSSVSFPVVIFGNLGLPELVCIISCSKFEQLDKANEEIKKSIETSGIPILDLTTLPGVNLKYIENGKLTSDEHVDVLLLLSLFGLSSRETLEKLVSCGAKDVKPTFGFYDLMARFGDAPLKEVINSILEIRRENIQHSLYSTSTIARHGKGISIKMPALTWKSVASNELIRNFLRKNPETMDDYGYCYNLFLTTVEDPFSRNLISDLTPFFKALSGIYEEAKELKQNEDLATYQTRMTRYDSVIDCLRLTFQQRYSGMQIHNLLGAKNLNIESFGGDHKILFAHEALTRHLLEEFGIEWIGFSVFGYSHKFYRTSGGIINMPSETRLHPEDWWGTYHEAGHEAFMWLNEKDKEQYEKLLSERAGTLKEWNEKGYGEDYAELLWEAFSDIFDFRYGFNCDWKFYLNSTWAYLVNNFPLNPDYLARMLLVYFSLGPGQGQNPKSSGMLMLNMLKELEDFTQKIKPKAKFDKLKREACYKCLLLYDDIKICVKFFSNVTETNKNYKEINECLRAGICIEAQPHEIVNALAYAVQTGENLSLKQRISAILSLYDWRSS